MDPRAILDDSGVLVGWMFTPDEPCEGDMTPFEDWHLMGYISEDGLQ